MVHECIFCDIASGKIKADIVDESDHFIAFKDIRPRTPGHTLIIPKQHFVTLLDIPNKLGEELLSFAKHVSGTLLDKKFGDGFNVLMNNLPAAGQIVMHAHIHVIPRKENDSVETIG